MAPKKSDQIAFKHPGYHHPQADRLPPQQAVGYTFEGSKSPVARASFFARKAPQTNPHDLLKRNRNRSAGTRRSPGDFVLRSELHNLGILPDDIQQERHRAPDCFGRKLQGMRILPTSPSHHVSIRPKLVRSKSQSHAVVGNRMSHNLWISPKGACGKMQSGAMIMASMQHNVAVMPHNPQASPLTNYAVVAMRDSVGMSCCARCVCTTSQAATYRKLPRHINKLTALMFNGIAIGSKTMPELKASCNQVVATLLHGRQNHLLDGPVLAWHTEQLPSVSSRHKPSSIR